MTDLDLDAIEAGYKLHLSSDVEFARSNAMKVLELVAALREARAELTFSRTASDARVRGLSEIIARKDALDRGYALLRWTENGKRKSEPLGYATPEEAEHQAKIVVEAHRRHLGSLEQSMPV